MTAKRVYYSTTQQVSEIYWDPTLMASEDPVNSSGKLLPSLFLISLILSFLL